MLDKARPYIKPVAEKVAAKFTWLHPNYITILGFCFSILTAYLISQEEYLFALLSSLLALTDLLDGTVARMTGKESKFGGVLDSTLDRLSDMVLISAFAMAGVISWELAAAVAYTSYTVSYVRSRAELAGDGGFKLAVGIIERPERLGFLVIATAVLMLDYNFFAAGYSVVEYIFAALLVLSLITVLQRLKRSHELLK